MELVTINYCSLSNSNFNVQRAPTFWDLLLGAQDGVAVTAGGNGEVHLSVAERTGRDVGWGKYRILGQKGLGKCHR